MNRFVGFVALWVLLLPASATYQTPLSCSMTLLSEL